MVYAFTGSLSVPSLTIIKRSFSKSSLEIKSYHIGEQKLTGIALLPPQTHSGD